MDLLHRSIIRPIREVAMHRTPGRQVLGQRPPLAACRQYIHNAVDHLANDNLTTTAAMPRWRDQRLEHRPFLVRHVARVTEMASVVLAAVLNAPHAAPRESVPPMESWVIQ